MPSNHYSITSASFLSKTINKKDSDDEQIENYSMISNDHIPSMTYPSNLSMCTRLPISSQQPQQLQQHPLLLVAEEAEMFDNDSDKLVLPRSTRLLKRRTSLFEKSRDWARRLITLHRARRNTTSNEKIRETCCQMNKTHSHHEFLSHQSKSFDEDGYLSPMEIKSKLDNLNHSQTTPSFHHHQHHHQSLSKLPTKTRQQLIVYSHSSSDISQPVYRCQGPITQPSTLQCTCHRQQLLSTSSTSEFHKSISVVDYIDFDVSEESSSSSSTSPSSSPSKPDDDHDDDDPLSCLKYLFDETNKSSTANFVRRTPRRSTNTSSISADSGYCDIPMASSKFIPVHLISCTLIPVNVTRTESMDIRCVTCTCPTSAYFSTKTERRRRKSSTNSSRSHLPGTYSRQTPSNMTENDTANHCLCNNKYYSTMTICPKLSLPSVIGAKSTTRIDVNPMDDVSTKQQKKKTKKDRPNPLKLSSTVDDLTSVLRWYKPNLSREVICQVLQQADYGAFVLRKSTTHPDCYALSVKVPKFAHDSNISHYLIEKLMTNKHTSSYRIKGTIKQFPTLLSLLTHHSVMPEILPITLNLNEVLPV
ncbi:unnamed protein product [Adineta ricciae]|uniref:SH2 domain-containing protein n=1 Tax=Adineta ricciae TaxID=249248 RepID=A0A816E6B0_ADIRI|nr:unnamed protein product [Adineta ricciae]CAF1645810.1 unnamed protein product [Adineta ricciae]